MARFNNLGKAIGIAIQKDEQGIRQLLKRNGVDTSNANTKTKQQLSDAFVVALFKSKGLAKDFSDYVKSKVSAESNFDGIAKPVSVLQPQGLSGLTIEPIKLDLPKTSTSTTMLDSPQKGGFFSGLNLAELINLAGTVYVNENSPEAVNQTKVGATNELNSDYNGEAKSSNTGMYVLLGIVGLLAIGTVVFFVKKKK